jgi:hypothetical protein
MEDSRSGSGCLLIILGLVVLVIGFSLGTRSGGGTSGLKVDNPPQGAQISQSKSTSRSGFASGNTLQFVPQMNIASDVQNCLGDYSCSTIVSSTETLRNEVTLQSEGDLTVRDGGILFGDGIVRCWNPNQGGWDTQSCPSGGD